MDSLSSDLVVFLLNKSMIILWTGIYICMTVTKLLYHILKLSVSTNFNSGLLKPEYYLKYTDDGRSNSTKMFSTSKSYVNNDVQKVKPQRKLEAT